MTRPTFQIVLQALPRPNDATDPGAFVRLRRALKMLGRAFGFKVLDYKIVETNTATTKESTS